MTDLVDTLRARIQLAEWGQYCTETDDLEEILDEIVSLRERLEQSERARDEWKAATNRSQNMYYAGGFRAGIEAAASVCSKLADTVHEDSLVDGSEGYYLSQAANSIRALTAQKGK